MTDKILVELIVPDIEERYTLFLPISKRIGDIITLIMKAVSDLTNGSYIGNTSVALYNADTAEKYQPNELVYSTSIRNGAMLILL